jgi:hypothetical protein
MAGVPIPTTKTVTATYDFGPTGDLPYGGAAVVAGVYLGEGGRTSWRQGLLPRGRLACHDGAYASNVTEDDHSTLRLRRRSTGSCCSTACMFFMRVQGNTNDSGRVYWAVLSGAGTVNVRAFNDPGRSRDSPLPPVPQAEPFSSRALPWRRGRARRG